MKLTDIEKDLPVLNRWLRAREQKEEFRDKKERKYDRGIEQLQKAVDEKGNLRFKNIKLASATTSDPGTSSTTYVDIPQMEIPVTLASGIALILCQIPIHFSAGTGSLAASIRIVRDGTTQVGPEARQDFTALSIVNTLFIAGLDLSIPPGSYTYKAQWRVVLGTTPTIVSYSTNRQMLLVELG